jgi:hypothetical protein
MNYIVTFKRRGKEKETRVYNIVAPDANAAKIWAGKQLVQLSLGPKGDEWHDVTTTVEQEKEKEVPVAAEQPTGDREKA